MDTELEQEQELDFELVESDDDIPGLHNMNALVHDPFAWVADEA